MQHALWAGDEVTGATTFRIVRALDAGPTFGVMTERVRPTDTSGDLLARLAEGGAELLVRTLDGDRGRRRSRRASSPADGVSLAPKVEVADAEVDWSRPAVAIDRQVRACTPAPGAWTTYAGERLKLGPVRRRPRAPLEPGVLEVTKNAVHVGTGSCAVRARRRAAVRQEADAGRRLGPRLPGSSSGGRLG